MRICALMLVSILGTMVSHVAISAPTLVSKEYKQQQEQQPQEEDDMEDFFDDAPDHLEESARLSTWQLYVASLAQKLYIPEVMACGVSTYNWLSAKLIAGWAWIQSKFHGVTQSTGNEQQQ